LLWEAIERDLPIPGSEFLFEKVLFGHFTLISDDRKETRYFASSSWTSRWQIETRLFSQWYGTIGNSGKVNTMPPCEPLNNKPIVPAHYRQN
jgi:hypothetical protein